MKRVTKTQSTCEWSNIAYFPFWSTFICIFISVSGFASAALMA